MTEVRMRPPISDAALETLFRNARSYNGFEPGTISETTLRALYEITKEGPTTANSQPQRILFLSSQEAKNRLDGKLSKKRRKKIIKTRKIGYIVSKP